MALAIGGRTVEELKEAMTYAEYAAWVEYRKAHGTLAPALRIDAIGTRLDYGFGFLAMMINSATGTFPHKKKLEDFLLFKQEPDATVEDVVKMIGAKKAKRTEKK